MNSFLPVGSVISLKNNNRKYIVLGYFPITAEEKIYDYLCFNYPNGLKDKEIKYVEDDEIDIVYFIGYQSKYNDKLLDFLKEQSSILKSAKDIRKATLEMVLKYNERYGKKVDL